MSKRRLETLTNEELSLIFKMRNRKLEAWLKKNTWEPGRVASNKQVYYREARRHSLLIMECLAELEARAMPNSEYDVPYLAKSLGEGAV